VKRVRKADGGTKVHVIPFGSRRTLCGMSQRWNTVVAHEPTSCHWCREAWVDLLVTAAEEVR